MKNTTPLYHSVVIGGSYAGLSAALTLGRSGRSVLVLDAGLPCNRFAVHAHNFLTQDGRTPQDITRAAKENILSYPDIQFLNDEVIEVSNTEIHFMINTTSGKRFSSQTLLFATGLTDLHPPINGFAACWGNTILHCPYCHGFEAKNKRTAVIGNGDLGYDMAMLLTVWTHDLILLCNGASSLSPEQHEKLALFGIAVDERIISSFEHLDGLLKKIHFNDGSEIAMEVVYHKPVFVQHSDLPAKMGCLVNEHGHIEVDEGQHTSVPHVYAAGDNCSAARSISLAVAAGTRAAFSINVDLLRFSLEEKILS